MAGRPFDITPVLSEGEKVCAALGEKSLSPEIIKRGDEPPVTDNRDALVWTRVRSKTATAMAQFEPHLIRHPQCIVSHLDSVLEPTD
jgi:hypothetical protein